MSTADSGSIHPFFLGKTTGSWYDPALSQLADLEGVSCCKVTRSIWKDAQKGDPAISAQDVVQTLGTQADPEMVRAVQKTFPQIWSDFHSLAQETPMTQTPGQDTMKTTGQYAKQLAGQDTAHVAMQSVAQTSASSSSHLCFYPYLYTIDLKIFFAVICLPFSQVCGRQDDPQDDTRKDETGGSMQPLTQSLLLTGPVSIRALSTGQLRRFYRDMNLTPGTSTNPVVLSIRKFLHLLRTQAAIVCAGQDPDQNSSRHHVSGNASIDFSSNAFPNASTNISSNTFVNDSMKVSPEIAFSGPADTLQTNTSPSLPVIFTDQEILRNSHLPETLLDEGMRRDEILFQLSWDEEEQIHHSYQKERYLLSCVREGRTQKALQQCAALDLEMGQMSRNEIGQWRKTVTVSVTLCSRAAIEGGLPPAQAYTLSDLFLQKSDACRSVAELIDCRNQAVRTLTERVHYQQEHLHRSSYVESCKDYVRKNYKSKIYVRDIASRLGISETYLSRLFARETGENLADYIVRVRVEKAANLLLYSEESIADIAEYVNFPSQSYFGRVFRKYKGMTPGQFRSQYKPGEFGGEQ